MKNLGREILLLSIALSIVSFLVSSLAHGSTAPRSLAIGSSDPEARALGGVCYSVDLNRDGLPCNPAFIAREIPSNFRAQLFVGDNITYLREVTSILNGSADQETIHDLFSQTRASEAEASIEGAYRRPLWGVAFQPYRLVYFSQIRNSSLPVITLLAAQEQTLRGQFGSYLGDDWSWGVQVRGVRRTYISRTFSLTDAAAEDGQSLLDPQHQSAFYVEPGLLKEFPDLPWKPQVTFAVTQLGIVDHKVEDFPASPQWHVGGAVHAPVPLGDLQFGGDIMLDSETTHWGDPFRLGTSYELGVTKFSASAGASDYACGFQLRYHDMTGGLTYTSDYIENQLGENEWVRTIYLNFGFNI